MAKWGNINRAGNVVDRRSGGGLFMAGGIGSLLLAAGVTYLLGGNPLDVLRDADPAAVEQSLQGSNEEFEGNDEYEQFTAAVLGSADAYWEVELPQHGSSYTPPTLVLFRGGTQSACGGAFSQTGPHYCPLDSTIYLDETFFEELTNRLGATGGDVAEAYVIAHEVGHHVQNLSGQLDRTRNDNEASIAVELRADCYAGLWASSLKDEGVFEPGEIKEAMDAAAAVGDDRIQSRTTGEVSPESWTHGSSEQRVAAFMTGYETGSYQACGQL